MWGAGGLLVCVSVYKWGHFIVFLISCQHLKLRHDSPSGSVLSFMTKEKKREKEREKKREKEREKERE